MTQKNNLISVRVSDSDLRFLEGLSIDDAETPSEKLRAIIKQARLQEAGTYSYEAALEVMRGLLEPVAGQIREIERRESRHSELLIQTYHWLKEIAAYMLSGVDQEDDATEMIDLATLEQQVMERLVRQVEYLMRLAVTEQAPCYDPGLVRRSMPQVLTLARLVMSQQQHTNKENAHD